MSLFSTIGDMIADRRSRRDNPVLRAIAEEHFTRLEGRQVVTGPEDVPYGELVLQSGVSKARERAARPFAERIDTLARQHNSSAGEVIRNERLLADLPAREHVVTVPGHHPAKLFHLSPDLAGDALPTTAARTEHDQLDAIIAADREAGAVRHTNGVSKFWKFVAYFLMFVDVLALMMVMIPAENTAIDPQLFTGDESVTHISRMVTAIALSLLGACVMAVVAHIFGDICWGRIHRRLAGSSHPPVASGGRLAWVLRRVFSDPAMIVGWGMLLLVSVVTGMTMYFRISHSVMAAVDSIGSSTGAAIAVMIALMATAGPICVAVVSALSASPEVTRRNALGAILVRADRAETAALERIDAAQVAMSETLEEAGRVMFEAEREVREAGAPATQTILEMRSRYGYAGDLYTSIGSVAHADGSEVFDTDPLSRPRAVIDGMRAGFVVAGRDAREPRVTYREAYGADIGYVAGSTDATDPPASAGSAESADPTSTPHTRTVNGQELAAPAVEFQNVVR